jgi:hypothetical protein
MIQFAPTRLFGLLLLCMTGTGCLHFHSPADEKSAKDIVDRFATFRGQNPSLFSKMRENIEATRVVVRQQRSAVIENEQATFMLGVANTRWDSIGTQLANAKTARSTLSTFVREQTDAALIEAGRAATGVQDAKAALDAAKKQVKDAQSDQLLWKTRRFLIQETIVAGSTKEILDEKAIADILKDVLEKDVPGETSNGNPVKVRDVLKEDLKQVVGQPGSQLLVAYTFGAFLSKTFPGLQITMLGMGVDLTDARLRRAQLEQDRLRRKLESLEFHLGSEDLLDDAISDLNLRLDPRRFPSLPFDKTLSPFQTLDRIKAFDPADPAAVVASDPAAVRATKVSQRVADKDDALRAVFEIVGYYVASMTTNSAAREQLVLNVELAEIEQDYSYELSALNALEREAVLGRQLDALAIYHAGGFKPEDIGNAIGVLQLAAQAAIAGQVK